MLRSSALLVAFALTLGCNLKAGDAREHERHTTVIRLDHTDVCLIVYDTGQSVALLRVGCDEVPNPLRISVDQLLERRQPWEDKTPKNY